jgi:hypothetical protein
MNKELVGIYDQEYITFVHDNIIVSPKKLGCYIR